MAWVEERVASGFLSFGASRHQARGRIPLVRRFYLRRTFRDMVDSSLSVPSLQKRMKLCGVLHAGIYYCFSELTDELDLQNHHLRSTTRRSSSYEDGGHVRTHRRRSADEENDIRCRDFTEGNPEDNSLRSPYFPNTYPNNTNCVRILDAGPGNVIRLEFREMFRLEPSEGCQFDFLEVRDGRYGYNDVLDRFCGHRVPPSGVMSSGRYMYLHFRSDDTIEYEGFAAVYMVLPRPTQMSPSPGPGPELSPCIIPVTGVEGYVNRSDIDRHCPERVNQSTLWHSPLEGMWVINVTVGWKIQLAFLVFKLDKPNDCNQNFVQVFKDNTDMPSRLSEFCGAKAETVLSENNVMHVRYWATSQAINATFDSLFTAYREGNKKPCLDDEFDCQDDTCISRTLRCNNRINCRFLWDEEKEECKVSAAQAAPATSSGRRLESASPVGDLSCCR
ncbi:neuropilin and tolloid-like protein 2 [Schistocerca gregaria]|uniref:neuropilin and tolloid-like protein 2 n=1 Tax=Schistocerca gregaria TaxID=7010 RepID=UPI00211F37DF|nr:neuropilin and tolloid-like protein 2 [Schistocerca gregaria]